jgi:exopolysaccharide biosynthesis predicted pyruvyltransferase EpsI
LRKLNNKPNIGDSAIWVGEIILLERLGIEVVYRCSSNEDYHPHQMKEALYGGTESRRVPKSETAILLHGGGNFGDLYKVHQRLRSRVVSSFTSSKIVSFPQTITFIEWNYLEKVKRDYSGHGKKNHSSSKFSKVIYR